MSCGRKPLPCYKPEAHEGPCRGHMTQPGAEHWNGLGDDWEQTLTSGPADEVADIEERLKLLRAASRSGEPLDEIRLTAADTANVGVLQVSPSRLAPTAQGHILSAITQLERRRAELLGKPKP